MVSFALLLTIAASYWGAAPECQVQHFQRPVRKEWLAFADNRCRITYNSAWRLPARRWCAVTIHEVGHLLGRTHAEGGIMSATLVKTSPRACWRITQRRQPPPA